MDNGAPLNFDPLAEAFQRIAEEVQPLQQTNPEQYGRIVQHILAGAGQLQRVMDEMARMYTEHQFLVTRLTPTLDNVLRLLKSRGFAPEHIVDCGAFEGDWTRQFAEAFPEAKVLMVEGLREKEPVLEGLRERFGDRVEHEITVLGAADGDTCVFHEWEACSSLYCWRPQMSKPVERTTETLETVLKRHPGYLEDGIDLMKIDLEGAEATVLRSIEHLLPRITVILMEVHVVPIDPACMALGELISWLEEKGYRFFDICTTARQDDGMLNFADLAFIREDNPYLPEFGMPISEVNAP